MGDRGTIQVKQNGTSVYLYTHWTGSELRQCLLTAMRKKWRWNDQAYLARIIFCEMIKGSEMEETGFGISPGPIDDGIKICVDLDQQNISQKSFPTKSFAAFITRA